MEKCECSKEHEELNEKLTEAVNDFVKKTGAYVHWISVDHMDDENSENMVYEIGSRVYDR